MSSKLEVSFKKLHESALPPYRASPSAAGYDLSATSIRLTDEYAEYGTGLAMEIPEGYVGLLFPRSSISSKGWSLANSVGVIDSDYRGEIKFRFYDVSSQSEALPYQTGDRVGQIVITQVPSIQYVERNDLNESVRAAGGFGSTDGKNRSPQTPPPSKL